MLDEISPWMSDVSSYITEYLTLSTNSYQQVNRIGRWISNHNNELQPVFVTFARVEEDGNWMKIV